MAIQFSDSQALRLTQIIDAYLKSRAPENQLHESTALVLAELATEVGFYPSTVDFLAVIKHRPYSTLLNFVAFVGSPDPSAIITDTNWALVGAHPTGYFLATVFALPGAVPAWALGLELQLRWRPHGTTDWTEDALIAIDPFPVDSGNELKAPGSAGALIDVQVRWGYYTADTDFLSDWSATKTVALI